MKTSLASPARKHSRREFIAKTALASSAAALWPHQAALLGAAEKSPQPLVVFSKVYQELKLDFEEAAAVTIEAGLGGVDCPVRPGGEILPEQAAADLPRYVETLRRRKLGMPLLTTAVTSVSTPHAEEILRTAKKSGVQFYRLGFIERRSEPPVDRQIREVKAQLKELAALNREIGIGAVLQNHSPAGRIYLGGDLTELREIVADFDPAQIGVAFDIAHALVVHGEDWRPHFEKLKSHLKVVYVKDVKRGGGWVPFGAGDVGHTDYFKRLAQIGYLGPVSLHIEFEWTDKGKSKTRAALVQTLRDSSRVLKQWLAAAQGG